MTEENSHLTVVDRKGVSVVEFADRKILDELCISEIREELAQLVSGNAGIKLLLSFKNVEHLSSAALALLITIHEQVKEGSGALKLSDIKEPIFEVFKITKLNKLFDIHETAGGAINAF